MSKKKKTKQTRKRKLHDSSIGKAFLCTFWSVTSWRESTGNEAHESELLLPRSQLGRVDGLSQKWPAKPRTGEQGLGTVSQPKCQPVSSTG